jgi:hypothetical protein
MGKEIDKNEHKVFNTFLTILTTLFLTWKMIRLIDHAFSLIFNNFDHCALYRQRI